MWWLPHVFSVLGFLLGVFLLSRILRERRPPASTMAWLLAIVLAPYVGVPMYFLIGGRKHRRLAARKAPLYPRTRSSTSYFTDAQHSIERVLVTAGVPGPTSGNRIELLTTGEVTYARVLDLFESAQHSIDVSTFILGADETGAAMLDALTRSAARGVKVRLLLDGLFALKVKRRALVKFTRAGGRLAVFMPLLRLPFRGPANLRNHRKIIVVDGQCGMIGGMNLAHEYMGPVPAEGRWRDLSATVTGPAVAHIHAVFRSDWAFAAHAGTPAEEPQDPPPEAAGTARAQVAASGPDVELDTYYDALLSALFGARKRIWIATPYFIPDEAICRALVLASRRDVDVRVVVPRYSNHPTADIAGGSYLRQIQDAGAHVRPYMPSMMHAKVTVVDDDLGILGSANLDMRSLFLDYEIALFVYSAPEIAELAHWFEVLLLDCGPEWPEPSRTRRVAEDLGRVLAPLM